MAITLRLIGVDPTNAWYIFHDFNYSVLLEEAEAEAEPKCAVIDLDYCLMEFNSEIDLQRAVNDASIIPTAAFTYVMGCAKAQELASRGVHVYHRLDDLLYDFVLARTRVRPKCSLVWPKEFQRAQVVLS